jgi:hypothetical protein
MSVATDIEIQHVKHKKYIIGFFEDGGIAFESQGDDTQM